MLSQGHLGGIAFWPHRVVERISFVGNVGQGLLG